MELLRGQYDQLVNPLNAFLANKTPGLTVRVDVIVTDGYSPDGPDGRYDYSGPGLVVSDERGRSIGIVADTLLDGFRRELAGIAGKILGLRLTTHIDPIANGLCGLTFVGEHERRGESAWLGE